jgi:hypothetical protein
MLIKLFDFYHLIGSHKNRNYKTSKTKIFCRIDFLIYTCTLNGANFPNWKEAEKGTRCKSWAVPAAVSSGILGTLATVS